MKNLLWTSSYRFLFRHPWQFLLSILGVALGVAVVVSIDLSNNSAKQAFELSTEAVTGKATHQVVGAGEFLPDSIYVNLKTHSPFRQLAPVIQGFIKIDSLPRTFQLLGIDPIAEQGFRSFSSQESGIDLGRFMSGVPSALLSSEVGEELGIQLEDSISILVEGKPFSLQIIGFIEPENDRSSSALNTIVVVDISTAQILLNKKNFLSRIDVILPTGKNEEFASFLPEGSQLIRSETRSETVAQMTRAFEFNLQALSLLALLVGMFLIYNTMTFSVVQRRPLIGRLRTIGVTKGEIISTVLKEALFIGFCGTSLGVVAGIGLAQGLVHLVTQSINDLYYVLSVRSLSIDLFSLLKGGILGMGATFLAAYWPAKEASEAEVSTVLRRSTHQDSLINRPLALSLWACGFILFGVGLLFIPKGGIPAGYASLLVMIIGFSLMVPVFIQGIAWAIRPIIGKLAGLIGKMAVRGIVTELSRTSVAIAALIVAVAATVGVGVMVSSFRATVVSWLESQLQADIYVQPPNSVARFADAQLDPALVQVLRSASGVEDAYSVRSLDVSTQFGTDRLIVVEQSKAAKQAYQFKEMTSDFWDEFYHQPVIMVSEVYAYRKNLGLNDTVFIKTEIGIYPFIIKGINYDYASDLGSITLQRRVFERYFNDTKISGLALTVKKGVNTDSLVQELQNFSEGYQQVFIRSNRGLREASIEIFDRTFTVTIVLRVLAIIVAFIGVLSALMALQLERARELAVLRANGMTPGQLWGYVITQTGIMGGIAGVLSVPLGILMAYILVYVINLRSFGWTLQFILSETVLFQAVLLAIVAALLAGIYPSWKMSKANPADALRSE